VFGESVKLARKLIRLLGPLLFVLILSRIDVRGVLETIASARADFLLGALLLYPGLIMLKTWRWHILLRQQQTDYGLVPAFVVYNSSLGVGYVTPGRLGEFVKALYLRQDKGVPLGQGFSSVVMDRLFDLYLLVIIACAGMLTISLPEQLSLVPKVALFLVALGPLVALIPAATRRVAVLLAGALTGLGTQQYHRDIERTLDSFQRGMESLLNLRLLLPLLVTVAAYGVFYLQCYLIAGALRLPLSYFYMAFCVSVASLVALLPISVSGLGVRDATFLALLLPLGVTAELAVSYSLLILLVFNVFGGVMGAIAWFGKPLR
jgi:uncharacterized protein (TIRG00374 family)